MNYTSILIHYHEVALKRGNRDFFEERLAKNIMLAARPSGGRRVRRMRGRMFLDLMPGADIRQALRALERVFGIAYMAPVAHSGQDITAITETALRLAQTQAFQTFRIETRRSQKDFPHTSMEVNQIVGDAVRQASGASVDLDNPEKTLFIEIFDQQAALYMERVPGPGGLPSGTAGRAVCLLSSGIDSPVAAFRMMRRGVKVIFVHFHSAPYTSEASKQNTERLVEILTRYQFSSKLFLVPFLEIQQQITTVVPAQYRVVMYRRAMFRLAEAVARRVKAQALITGENVAQVASQTLPNIRVINQATTLPVLRPLAGDDKQEIIAQAQKIGTFEVSIQPYEDCCSLFVPKNPELRADLKKALEFEASLNLADLTRNALQQAEKKEIML